MTALGIDVPFIQVAKLVSKKSTQRLNSIISQRNIASGAPIYDVYTIPLPSQTVVSYEILIRASFRGHINSIREKIRNRMDTKTVPSFRISLAADERDQGVRRGQGSGELQQRNVSDFDLRTRQDDYYLVGYLEGGTDDGGNFSDATDQEQIYESTMRLRVPVALMLEPDGEPRSVKVERTSFGIRLGDETVKAVSDPEELDRIFGRRK